MFMRKSPVSVTLDEANLTWLRGRVTGAKHRSLSDALNSVVTRARLGGRTDEIRTVVGTVDVADADPGLDQADEDVRRLLAESLGRPLADRGARPQTARRPSR
jgi:hypothetical protein